MNSRVIKSLFLFIFFAFGYFVTYWYNPNASHRNPAAINKNFDFTHLNGTNLLIALKYKLSASLQVAKTNEEVLMGISNFVFKDKFNIKRSACDEFQKIIFKFEGNDYSSSSVKPEMEIEGGCITSEEVSRLEPLRIPVVKILQESPGDGIYEYDRKSYATAKFSHIDQVWPKKWILTEISLIRTNNEAGLIVEKEELKNILGNLIAISF